MRLESGVQVDSTLRLKRVCDLYFLLEHLKDSCAQYSGLKLKRGIRLRAEAAVGAELKTVGMVRMRLESGA